MDNGQAGCGQHPWGAHLSFCSRGPACLAWPAWHRFLDPPIPREAASPPAPFQGPGAPPQTQAESTALPPTPPQGQDQKPTPGRSRGGESIFSLLFFSSIKRIKNPRPVWPSSVRHASQHPGGLGVVFADLGPWVRGDWGGLVGTAPCLRSGPFLSLSSEMLAQRVQVWDPASPPCFQQGAAGACRRELARELPGLGVEGGYADPLPSGCAPHPGKPDRTPGLRETTDRGHLSKEEVCRWAIWRPSTPRLWAPNRVIQDETDGRPSRKAGGPAWHGVPMAALLSPFRAQLVGISPGVDAPVTHPPSRVLTSR